VTHSSTPGSVPSGRRVGLHLVMPVWGPKYVSLFCNTILPFYLTAGNLPAIRNERRVLLKVYMSTDDLPVINSSVAFQRALELIEIELIYVDDMLRAPHDPRYGSHHHDVMTRCHKEALRVAGQQGAAAVILTADTVFADGTLRRLGCLLDEGKRAVLVAGPRVVEEAFLEEFRELPLGSGSEDKTTPIAFTDFCLRHLHPISRSAIWNESEFFNTHPSHLYWQVADEGFIAHCFHMHPLMIRPPEKEVQSRNTIDDDYLAQAGFTADEIHVVTDNLTLPLFSLAPRDLIVGNGRPHTASVAYVADWAATYTRPFHRQLARTKVCFYTRMSSPLWEDLERVAQEALSDIETIATSSGFRLLLNRPDLFLEKNLFDSNSLSFHPKAAELREYFRDYAPANSDGLEAKGLFSWYGILGLAHFVYLVLVTSAFGLTDRIRRRFRRYPRLHDLVYRKLCYGVIRRSYYIALGLRRRTLNILRRLWLHVTQSHQP
jgi:hypothetical protein